MNTLIKILLKETGLIVFLTISLLLFTVNNTSAQSCLGNCGSGAGSCFCDDTCWSWGDCCFDVCTHCGTYSQTMINNCGTSGGGGCEIQASVCTPGVAGPFSFNPATPHIDFHQGCLNTEQGFNNYGFILLNITSSGYLNMLINADTNNGYLDVSLFNVPSGQDPCAAILNSANNIGCGFAQNESGCNQFGNTFPCSSNFNAPYVTAGQQIMIIVQDWGAFNNNPSGNSSFSLTLSTAPGSAATGAFDASINPVGTICINEGNVTLTSVTGGGTWSASCGACIDSETGVFNPVNAGVGNHTIDYIVGESPCTGSASTTVNVQESVTPGFTQLGPYCQGETPDIMPTSSNNGVTGSWNPATINTNTAGTSTYTFTPNSGQCSENVTMNIVVNPKITPVFDSFGPYCQNETPDILPNLSNNSISGTWTPSLINTESIGTQDYLFEYDAGQCSENINIQIVVEENILPTFDQLGPYCVGDVADDLNLTSNNGVPGTWNPSVISTATSGATNYTFTPNSSVCALNQTMTVTVNPGVVPQFDQLGPYCIGDIPDALSGNSLNGISGNWNPSEINTSSPGNQTYTFNPDAGQCAETYNMNINVSDLTIPQFDIPGPYCEDDIPDQLPTTSNNGITGTWSPSTINTSIAGLYTHIFTPTTSECVDNSEIEVTVNQNPTAITEVIQPVLCFGGTATVNISAENGLPPYQGIGEFVLSSGQHDFLIIDDNGCTDNTQLQITQPNQLILSTNVSSDILCFGDTGEAVLNISGGVSEYTIFINGSELYSTNDSEILLQNLDGGQYNIIVVDVNGCEANANFQISNPDPIELEIVSITNQVCETPGYATVMASGGTQPYTYIWPTNAGSVDNETAHELSPGNYTVTVIDINNCEQTIDVIILGTGDVEANFALGSNPTCHGFSDGTIIVNIIEGEPPYIIEYGTNSHTSNTNQYTITNLQSGSYSITVTDANGCEDVGLVNLTDPSLLEAILVSSSDQTCESPGSAVINASGGIPPYNYNWPQNAGEINDGIANELFTGTYTVTVTDDNNCESTITFTINDFSNMSVAISVLNHVKCFGGTDGKISIEIADGTPDYSISWNFGSYVTSESNIEIEDLSAGEITINVSDNYGCTDHSTVIIQEPAKLEANYFVSHPSCIGMNDGYIEIMTSGGTEPYLFSWNNENYTDIPHIVGLGDGLYNITIYDVNQCHYEINDIRLIENKEDCLEIPNAFTPNGDGINDEWIITNIEMFPSAIISVFNKWGQVVYFARGNEEPWDGTHDGKFVPTGTYLYVINLQNRSKSITGTLTVVY